LPRFGSQFIHGRSCGGAGCYNQLQHGAAQKISLHFGHFLVSTVNLDKPFRRCVLAAGLDVKQVVRHTLRHTAITHLVQAGVDLPTVKRISGHKNLSMVERYSHQNGAHIQTAMDKLSERYKLKTS
jgi:integrase